LNGLFRRKKNKSIRKRKNVKFVIIFSSNFS
jgi:hypothetical protein